MTYVFAITQPSGETVRIIARCRSDAIEQFLSQSGMPRDFFKRNCTVRKG